MCGNSYSNCFLRLWSCFIGLQQSTVRGEWVGKKINSPDFLNYLINFRQFKSWTKLQNCPGMIHYISYIFCFFLAKSYGTFKSCWSRQMDLADWRTWLVHQVAGAKDSQRGIGLNERAIVCPVWSRLEWNEWMAQFVWPCCNQIT